MKEIPLTQSKVALVDDEDYDWLSKYKWYASKTRSGNWYACNKPKKANILMHRLILGTPTNLDSDHIDNNGLNNQRANLRICTRSQNNMNRFHKKNSTSKYKGVTWHNQDKKWRTRIRIRGTDIYNSLFDSELEAAKAYDAAALKYFGEYARLNFN